MNSKLRAIIEQSNHICVLTGAGISTESGIPDFRSPGGIWSQYRIIEYGEFIASPEARLEDWRRRFDMEDQLGVVEPNSGHDWIAKLVESGKCFAVVTQNIDGLHQQAGVPDDKIIELHGTARHAICLECGQRHEIAQCRERLQSTGRAPDCNKCGGVVKSAVIMFGEAMPEAALSHATQAAQSCDLFIAMGTSLVVQPAALLPIYAKRAGAKLAIVNREPTDLDDFADHVIHGEIGQILQGQI